MIRWLEESEAPDQIIATKYIEDDFEQGVLFQRPLCVYPKKAVYLGGGKDNTKADSFECK